MKKKPFFHSKALVETSQVGAGTRVWAFAHVMKGARVGKDCNIGDHCYVEGKCVIGDRVTIKNGVSVWDAVTVENDVFIGPNAVFTNDLFPISRKQGEFVKTLVRTGSCIGANSTIICGVEIGRCAFVGAGSVVTRNVPDFALAYGNPARIRGYLCRCRKKIKFTSSSVRCVCGLRYRKASDGVKAEK
jgi:serine acetyltransferase